MQEKESCRNCKRYLTHGGTCTCQKGMIETCLGYEKDPRGKLIREEGRLKLDDNDFKVGEWTKSIFVTSGKSADTGRKLKISRIESIKWSDDINDYEIAATYEYFENPDKEENQAAEKCKLKKYLKENGIKNVAIFGKRSN